MDRTRQRELQARWKTYVLQLGGLLALLAVAALGYLRPVRRFARVDVPPPQPRTWYQEPE